jgi:hypothetical protein
MITVLLVTDYAEVVILHYKTDSEDEAAHLIGADWSQGRVIFESTRNSELFSPEWIKDSIHTELIYMEPQYENGVRVIEFYCTGPDESDDRKAWAYFIHSNDKHGQPTD